MNTSTMHALRGIRNRPALPKVEMCELCGATLTGEHPHVLDRGSSEIRCACDACAILFSHRHRDAKFTRIPRRIRRLEDFLITDAEWAGLLLPIDMAFFVNSTAAGRTVAYYPSPAGCTESLLSLSAWNDIAGKNPGVERMEPDVEALLVNRTRGRRDYFIAPLDHCYRLTGLIRVHWRGLSGGDEVWKQIDQFFDGLAMKGVHA